MADRTSQKRPGSLKKISEALSILETLGVPREQQNERSALTLLALLGITPGTRWEDAQSPMLGITEMMNYFEMHFGKKYAPNTRETVRRFTIHQFVQMGLVLANPDNPGRPVNSPDNRYQIAPTFLELIREYGFSSWDESIKSFVKSTDALRRLQPRERKMVLIPVGSSEK